MIITLCHVLRCFEHIFGEDAVAAGRIVHQNVGDGAYELAVLKDGAAAHECVNIGATNFMITINIKGKFRILKVHNRYFLM